MPAECRIFFYRWPELAVRIATSFAIIEKVFENGVLETRLLKSAVVLLQDYAERQASVLGRLLRRRNETSQIDDQVEKLVQRLQAKGPQTLRQLARSYSGQNYDVIDNRIFEAIRRGRVVQRGKLYCVPDVNVNASTMPNLPIFDKEVRA